MEKENPRIPEKHIIEDINSEAPSAEFPLSLETELKSEKVEEERFENSTKGKEEGDVSVTLPSIEDNIRNGAPPIQYKPERQKYWLDKRDLELEEAYRRIAPDIPLVNVNHKRLFLEKCKKYYAEMVKNTNGINPIDRWDEYEIVRMFGKGLNPTSLKTALNNIEFLVENIKSNEDVIRVIEFGPGSGWSTLMLRNKLHEKFKDKKIELYSVDMSPHSIVATQNSLDYYQIPWQTEMGAINVSEIEKSEDYVNLVVGDFIKFAQEQPDNYFHGFFSSHGTAYLSQEEYEELLEVISNKGKDNAPLVVDSLDPMYTVKLNTLHLLYCSIFPSKVKKMPEYVYGKGTVSSSKYFAGQEVKTLTKVHNKESDLFYNWNNFLLSKRKFRYFLEMLQSIKVTTDVINEYRDDVFPSYLVTDLVKKNNEYRWKVLEDLPECPLYITNCGLILEK